MKVFVTGGSGFVGPRLITKFVDDGHEVFGLARSPSSADKVRALGATPVQGDLGGAMTLPAVDTVVHAAAHFRFAGPRAPYLQTNVVGTQSLLRAARDSGASTFVYVSAAGVVMDDKGTPLRHVDETAPTYPNSFSGYIASKAQGEAAVLAADAPGFRTVVVRPSAIWGPGDAFGTALPEAIRTGRFAFVGRGEYAFATTHVDNVVEAVVCAAQRGTGGRAYFVNDRELVTFREFVAGQAQAQGLSIDKIRSVPYRVAFVAGRLLEFVAAIGPDRGDPPLTRTMIRMIGREFTPDDAAARHELGYVGEGSRAQGLQELARAYASHG